MKGFDYSREIKNSKTYDRLFFIGEAYAKRAYKINYIGLENVPKEGGFILAANHVKSTDPVLLSIPIKGRQLHFMGKKELFENPVAKWMLTKLNGFPIVRGGADCEAMKYAVRVVKEGNILGIFPEGTRSKDYKPARAKSGVALIAKEAKADVLPVSIYTRDDMKHGTRLTIRYGKLIPYEELGLSEDPSRQEIRDCAAYIMKKIVDLWSEGHCE